jgi:hypothetical protein
MAAFATVRMTVDLAGSGKAELARDVVETFPGTRAVAVDALGGTLDFELQFPGNLSALVRRLRESAIAVASPASVTLPVVALVPELVADPQAVAERLVEGPEVWDVAFARGTYVLAGRFTGDRVEASVQPRSESMHELYDAMLSVGLVASDVFPPYS